MMGVFSFFHINAEQLAHNESRDAGCFLKQPMSEREEVGKMWAVLAVWFMLVSGQPIASEQVELFDTDEERVVSSFANSEAYQKEARKILDSVTARVLDLNPPLEHAYIVKIPLVPPQRLDVKDARIKEEITRMFVVMPKRGQRKPYLILHTKDNATLVLEFVEPVESLRQMTQL
jgi:hypothetical protein